MNRQEDIYFFYNIPMKLFFEMNERIKEFYENNLGTLKLEMYRNDNNHTFGVLIHILNFDKLIDILDLVTFSETCSKIFDINLTDHISTNNSNLNRLQQKIEELNYVKISNQH